MNRRPGGEIEGSRSPKAARLALHAAAQALEKGAPIVTKDREYVARILRYVAFGYPIPAELVAPKKPAHRPRRSDSSSDDAYISLRIACMFRLLELAGVRPGLAKNELDSVCGFSRATVGRAIKEWEIRRADNIEALQRDAAGTLAGYLDNNDSEAARKLRRLIESGISLRSNKIMECKKTANANTGRLSK